MKLNQVPLRDLEIEDGLVRATTPYILEYSEVAALVADFFATYRQLVNRQSVSLGPRQREANAESYELLTADSQAGRIHFVYDADETRIGIELAPPEAQMVYRLLREQLIVRPDLEQIRRVMSANLAETVAAILWQIGAIKVSLGDLRPYFRVDEGRNWSPIYIDVKGLASYPAVNDFVLGSAALLLRNLEFDSICGIEAGSIAIAAVLAKKLAKPMFYARRQRRYPEASLFEGAKSHELFRRRVLLVDDTLVHGWTKTRVISAIREQGGVVDSCFVIFDRQQHGAEELAAAGVRLYSLTNREAAFSAKVPREISLLTDQEAAEVAAYFEDPAEWHRRRGLVFHPPTRQP